MPRYLDTRGNSNLGIGICARCNRKFPLHELVSDPNAPGMRVCIEDRDNYDPYRLPARRPDQITLPFTRPDVPLNVSAADDEEGTYLVIGDADLNIYVTDDSNTISIEVEQLA